MVNSYIDRMPLLNELGTAVRRRRQEIGLTQEALARVAGLSRATVTNLENGQLQNLSSTRIENLANSLGFSVGLLPMRKVHKGEALAAASQLASVSYKKVLPVEVLHDALKQGSVPPGYIPHLRTLLQEAPIAMLAALAEDLEKFSSAPKPDTWKRMRVLAAVLKCDRPIWST